MFHSLSNEKTWLTRIAINEYSSPISLTVDIILSDVQLNNGWGTDYLGMYEYVESYTSIQGYKVNLIQDTADAENVSFGRAGIHLYLL